MNSYNVICRRDFLKKTLRGTGGLFAICVAMLLPKEVVGEIVKIPERVRQEIRWARDIILQDNPELFLKNGYVVSALYYSDQFLQQGLVFGKTENNVSWQIIDGIKDLITPQKRKQYVAFLRERYSNSHPFSKSTRLRLPLKKINWGNLGKGETHPHAVDLFIPEGSDVFSISSGLVVLAENGWQKDDPFSTSSFASGNTVIIFHLHENEFYRYSHLARATPNIGKAVSAGNVIGIVGHTGKNASLPRRGNHLHLEIHHVDDAGHSIPHSHQEIRQRIMEIKQPRGVSS